METRKNAAPPLYVVSGGSGASGEQVVRTVLAQFPGEQVTVVKFPHVRRAEQLVNAVLTASETQGTIIYTLVNEDLRRQMFELARKQNVPAIDLMGPLLERVAASTGKAPEGKPGLYRQLHKEYFDRVSAIEFSIAHDDGQAMDQLSEAEIVILGVSRVGKTPLSMYLSVLGWKVANIPLLVGRPLPEELTRVEKGRVIGLTADPDQVLNYRKKRQYRMGVRSLTGYTDPSVISEEVEETRRLLRRGGYTVIDVSHKPIETTADEIIEIISRRFSSGPG